MAGTDLPVDTLVSLKGLQKAAHLNGRRGIVVATLSSNGRIGVQLFPKHEEHIVHAKPSNLLKEQYQLERPREEDIIEVCPCAKCGASQLWKGMQVCSQCMVMSYCSRQCQNEDWPTHKKVCQGCRELRKNPKSTSVELGARDRTWAVIGLSLRRRVKGNLQQAEDVLRDAIDGSDPVEVAPLYALLAMQFQAQGLIDKAVAILRVGLPFAKDGAVMLHKSLGSSLVLQGDLGGALVEFKKALKMTPPFEILTCKYLYQDIGSCCMKLAAISEDIGDHDTTVQYYKEAIIANREYLLRTKNNSPTAKELGDAHHRLAFGLSAQTLFLLSHWRAIWVGSRGALMRSLKKTLKECINHWTKAVELDPSNQQRYNEEIADAQFGLANIPSLL